MVEGNSGLSFLDYGTFIVLLGTLIYTARQLHNLKKQHLNNHDLQMRIFCFSFEEYHPVDIKNKLEKYFGLYSSSPEPILLKKIDEKARSEYPNIRADINKLLTFYETICCSVEQGASDHLIIKRLYGAQVIRHFKIFRPYIDEVRKKYGDHHICEDMQKWACKWTGGKEFDSTFERPSPIENRKN